MEQSKMLPPDREREWSNFSGKSKVLITPLKVFLAVLILKQIKHIEPILPDQLLVHFIPPYWQNLTKVNVLHTSPWSIGAMCSHNYPQHLCISDTNCFCHTKCVQSSPTCVTSVSHDQIFMSPDHPTIQQCAKDSSATWKKNSAKKMLCSIWNCAGFRQMI